MNHLLTCRKGPVRQNWVEIYQKSVSEYDQKAISQSITLIIWIIRKYNIIKMKNFDFDKQFNYKDQNLVF
jgi:hypothetical protein